MDAKTLIETINDAGDYQARSYSGRGMYGETCVGVVLENRSSEGEFYADVVSTLVDDEAWDTLREFCDLMRKTSSDSMGLGIILYWKRVKWPEGVKTGRYYDDLERALENFDRKNALRLSDRIHDAEADGYEVTDEEDTLWAKLTDRLESNEETE